MSYLVANTERFKAAIQASATDNNVQILSSPHVLASASSFNLSPYTAMPRSTKMSKSCKLAVSSGLPHMPLTVQPVFFAVS